MHLTYLFFMAAGALSFASIVAATAVPKESKYLSKRATGDPVFDADGLPKLVKANQWEILEDAKRQLDELHKTNPKENILFAYRFGMMRTKRWGFLVARAGLKFPIERYPTWIYTTDPEDPEVGPDIELGVVVKDMEYKFLPVEANMDLRRLYPVLDAAKKLATDEWAGISREPPKGEEWENLWFKSFMKQWRNPEIGPDVFP
ncbi:MAG: hypothetical protein M1829_002655 [Trizodia sp. TS-e1964]|nr:MAG: hypothetical protein M1829_002655 [Trizodia sp. TS-e1964]